MARMEAKECRKCGAIKPLSEYRKNRGRPDGLESQCKTCQRARDAAWYKKNREAKLEYCAGWRAENPEYYREYDRRNGNRHSPEWGAEYYATNRDKIRASQAAYRSTPSGRAARRAANLRYKVRKLERDCGCTNGRALRLVMESGICACCGSTAEHVDHVVPLAKGGMHCVSNLVPSCAKCNLVKSDREFGDFVTRRGLSVELEDILRLTMP